MTTDKGDAAAPGIQSIHRALDALEAAGRAPGLGVTAMSKRMGVAVSTAHGIAATLTARRYLLHVDSGYLLGPSVAALAQHWDPARSLAAIFEPVMTELSTSIGMASTATVLEGDVAQIVTYVPAPGPITVRAGSRRRNPLELATGRLLVALGEDRSWGRFLAQSSGVEPGWGDGRWREELMRIRSAGIAVKTTRDPRLEVSMAVPVRGAGGSLVGAVGCSTPSFLAEDLYDDDVLARLLDCAERLSDSLGGAPAPRPLIDFAEYRLDRSEPSAAVSGPVRAPGAPS